MHSFWDIWLQKCRDLENRVRGPSTSLEYHSSIERIRLPISDVNKDWTRKDKDKDKDQAYKDKDKD